MSLRISQAEEANLASRLRQKDSDALGILFDTYGLAVFRLVLRIVRDRASSEDIVQDTFARVWHSTHMIDEGAAQLGPWLMTIARNLALDHLRSRGLRLSRHEELVSEYRAPGNSVEESLITEENARLVARALKTLNPNQKQVIDLAYFSGLSQAQIAAQLNQPLGTVKSWTRTALVHLRAVLQSKLKDIKHV